MRLQKSVSLVLLLQIVILAGQWLGAPRVMPTAQAQVTDPGRDRMQILDELRNIDQKLEKLNDLLASGKLQVRAVGADEGKGGR